jgi:hypothetical protein
MPNGRVYLELLIQQTGRVPTVVTHKSPTIWSRLMDHRKAERVAYLYGIQDFQSCGQSEAQKLCSVQPLFCPEIEFSSEVDLQNSVISKPLSGQGRMSNG